MRTSPRTTFGLTSLALLGVCAFIMRPDYATPPLPVPPPAALPAAAIPPLSVKERLGKMIFFDKSLSNPRGMACSTCHDPATGFTGPNSRVNEAFGPVAGVIPDRFGFRRPPTVSYAAYIPTGVPHYDPDVTAFVGGLFWDGRATDLADQAGKPFLNPNEMNNLSHGLGDPDLVVRKLAYSPEANLFQMVYGRWIFQNPRYAYRAMTDALAAYEKSREVSPFSSKYDAWRRGQAALTPEELDGLRLATGSWTGRPGGPAYFKRVSGQAVYKDAKCALCHGIPENPRSGPDLWTNTCYANLGVPKNAANPYYQQTDRIGNPFGFNPDGADFIDLGLGGVLYPKQGLPPGNQGPGANGHGDFLQINGTFKAPTLRNVALAPYPGFVKSYMHNGVFKSLKQVVHFYNTRSLTTAPGEVIDFMRDDPYAGLIGQPLWSRPEFLSADTLQNVDGLPGDQGGQVGNLGLTDEEEDHLVAFLKTLSDGYRPGFGRF